MASFSPDLPDLSGYSLPNQTVDRFSALDFRISEAQKPADYFSRKLFEQPIVFIRTVVLNQTTDAKHPQATGRAVCKLPNWFHPCIAASTVGESAMRSSSPSSASKPDAIRRQVRPMALRTFSRAAASRCRTDRQPAANRTSTAPRRSIPITSSSFLRQKAPQAGIKHASAPALRKHMP